MCIQLSINCCIIISWTPESELDLKKNHTACVSLKDYKIQMYLVNDQYKPRITKFPIKIEVYKRSNLSTQQLKVAIMLELFVEFHDGFYVQLGKKLHT